MISLINRINQVLPLETVGEREQCVACSKETEYFKHTPVDLRKHYIEGAGQLCHKCYKKIF